MPTSNETRVRVDAFWKIMASVRPGSSRCGTPRALQHLEVVGQIEQLDQLVAVELIDREQVAAGEAGRGGGEHGHGRKSMPHSA